MKKDVNMLYFSPTDTTKKVVTEISNTIYTLINNDNDYNINCIDFTLPRKREDKIDYTKDDIVIVGVPVYAGRVPNILVDFIKSIKGNGAIAVAVTVYGNRDYDDALLELSDILTDNNFNVIAAGAFIGEHSFSKVLGKDRPDESDLAFANKFGEAVYRKIQKNENLEEHIEIKGKRPYRSYYKPKNDDGEDVDIRKVTPNTENTCTDCKLCVSVCPMGSIDYDNVNKLNGICIKCCACIKKCPEKAKYFDDQDYLKHKTELELNCTVRREPEVFF